ncbi:amidase [Microbacterium endophyticum]|uniref:Amidase n=1 Tax=Microbacterium endophyticum TaxID=1526412 RepID=A0A7W4V1X1_9MICO|nr:amidase family protein [Microbacterium endophyticum]MBB2975358.1 amidase [Microbacterium endophyticum]NIK35623.1 amidase [Microbacterium endophyticum]
MTNDEPLHYWSATRLAAGVRTREISAEEVMRAHLARIEQHNEDIRAIVAMIPESEALAAARDADRAVARGDEVGPLHGLPTGVKDLMDAAGLPTTHGSAAHKHAAAATSDAMVVARMRAAGAIVIAKTNTPEAGLGTLTFNPIHGVCVNPYDTSRHAGGSSGGAAAALAAGMLPIADGSDSGGSLRYPAAFCNVVGVRPSPGRVASGRLDNGWTAHGVLGPMARSSEDAALGLAAMAGPDPLAPMSIAEDPRQFLSVAASRPETVTIGWSSDAGGVPISDEIARTHAQARADLEAAGYRIVDLEPDLSGAESAWQTIELFNFFAAYREEAARHPELMRPDLVRNIREGEQITAAQLADALSVRTAIFRRTERLFDDVDLLVFPATPVVAPPAEVEWVDRVGDEVFERYFRWQMLANRITVTAHPVVVTPAGFHAGIPVGMQVVGRHRSEARLLGHTAGIEQALGHITRRPQLA